TTHRQVIHGAIHRQRSDVASREKQWLHDKRVRGKCNAGSTKFHDRLVIQSVEHGIVKCRKEDVAQEVSAHSASATVTHQDRLPSGNRDGTIQSHIEFRVLGHQWLSVTDLVCRLLLEKKKHAPSEETIGAPNEFSGVQRV